METHPFSLFFFSFSYSCLASRRKNSEVVLKTICDTTLYNKIISIACCILLPYWMGIPIQLINFPRLRSASNSRVWVWAVVPMQCKYLEKKIIKLNWIFIFLNNNSALYPHYWEVKNSILIVTMQCKSSGKKTIKLKWIFIFTKNNSALFPSPFVYLKFYVSHSYF
jgi:hypothetical protein